MLMAACKFPGEFSCVTEGIKGGVYFRQENSSLFIEWNIMGLPKNSTLGFHVHENGFVGQVTTCDALGGHFNPYNSTEHGCDWKGVKHAGDLCNNIFTDDYGISTGCYTTNLLSLDENYNNCIIGRSIVIHAESDDLGLCGKMINGKIVDYVSPKKIEESLKTGNAGRRIACGNIIKISKK